MAVETTCPGGPVPPGTRAGERVACPFCDATVTADGTSQIPSHPYEYPGPAPDAKLTTLDRLDRGASESGPHLPMAALSPFSPHRGAALQVAAPGVVGAPTSATLSFYQAPAWALDGCLPALGAAPSRRAP